MSEPRLALLGPRCGTRQLQGQHSHQKPPSGQCAPPWKYQARFTGSLGSCPWNWTFSLPSGGPHIFLETTLPSRSPSPAKAEGPGKNQGPEARTGCRPRFPATLSGFGRAGHTPTMGSPMGSQACALPGWLRLLLWQKLPQPALRQPTLTERLELPKICAKPPKKGG